MLVETDKRVRAVFVGHTHQYSRIRVYDPAGQAANDLSVFPDEEGGIYQVDAGAAGHGDKNTVVHIQVKNKNIILLH